MELFKFGIIGYSIWANQIYFPDYAMIISNTVILKKSKQALIATQLKLKISKMKLQFLDVNDCDSFYNIQTDEFNQKQVGEAVCAVMEGNKMDLSNLYVSIDGGEALTKQFGNSIFFRNFCNCGDILLMCFVYRINGCSIKIQKLNRNQSKKAIINIIKF